MNDRDLSSMCVPMLGLIEPEGFLLVEHSSCPDLFANFSATSRAFVPSSDWYQSGMAGACSDFGIMPFVLLSYPLPFESLGSSTAFPWQRRPRWSHSRWPKKGFPWKTPGWRLLFPLFPLVPMTFLHQAVCAP